MPICTLDHVRKSYGSGAGRVVALHDLSLSFDAGDFLALAGPSGSGKTTALNLIGCLDPPDEGSIVLTGLEVTTLTPRERSQLRAERIGFIFQSFNLVPVLTARENVELALDLSGGDWPDASDRAVAILQAVGLGDLTERLPSQLSGGQQQRVAIARALVKEPVLVIADEPTANLDSTTGAAVLDLMRSLNEEQGATFVFSTHDPMVIARARRVCRLMDGRITDDEVRP